MTHDELQQLRRDHWIHLLGGGFHSGSLLSAVDAAGFLLAEPNSHLPLPSLEDWVAAVGVTGPDGATAAHDWLEEHLVAKRIVEINLWRPSRIYAQAGLLPYLDVLAGDREPAAEYLRQCERGELSRLAAEAYRCLLAVSPLTAEQLVERLGRQRTSLVSVESALGELTRTLKILRIGNTSGTPLWQPAHVTFPDLLGVFDKIGRIDAAAALASRLLATALADTEESLAEFFRPVMPLRILHSALAGLAAARVVAVLPLDGRPGYQLSPARPG